MNRIKNSPLKWMEERIIKNLARLLSIFALVIAVGHSNTTAAQCVEIISGLLQPLGTAVTNQGNLLVAETGTVALHTGRISIIDANGSRRTLLDGLPSALNDINQPSGPAGLFMRGRTLYVAIGVGDAVVPGPFPGTTIPNPAGASSPLFSSVLAIHFSAQAEKVTSGFTLSAADQQALAGGQTVTFSNRGADKVTIRMVADFPNFIPFPLPTFADNVQFSNPFQLVAFDDTVYVTDGGRNLVWEVDLQTNSVLELVNFPPIPNPLFGAPGLPGGPFLDAVPTGIAVSNDQLLVTLFRGVPFPPSTSTVMQVNPSTGTATAFITGLKTAIDVIPVAAEDSTSYLVLQHASVGPFFGGTGLVLLFDTPAGPPAVVTDCLTRPTSMTLDKKTDTLYVSEIDGRVVAIGFAP